MIAGWCTVRWRVIAAALMLLVSGAGGQQVSIETTLTPAQVSVGEPATYSVTVDGETEAAVVAEPAADGLELRYLGPQSQQFMQITNGRRVVRRSVTHRWQVVPTAAGEVEIGPPTLEIGGERRAGAARTLTVTEPLVWAEANLEMRFDEDALYVGQSTGFELVWTWPDGATVANVAYGSPPLPDGLDVELYYGGPQQSNSVRIWEMPATGILERRRVGTRRVQTFTVTGVITPTRAGTYTLDGIHVTANIGSRIRSQRPRSIVRAEPAGLTARSVPAEGRPANYTGLLGRYRIESAATPDAARVGDPIELNVAVTGDEPMLGVEAALDRAAADSLASGFRLSPDGWESVRSARPGERRFRMSVRAASADVEEIPPLRLASFDPGRGAYVSAASRAIPLEIQAVRQVTSSDAVVAAGGGPVIVREPLRLSDTAAGVWGIERSVPALLAAERPPLERLSRAPLGLLVLAVPPFVWLLVRVGGLIAARKDSEGARARRALRRALGRASDPGAAARGYVADVLGIRELAVAASDVELLGLDRSSVVAAALRSGEETGDAGGVKPSELRAALREHARGRGS